MADLDYAGTLQRIIEGICRHDKLPADAHAKAPHHAAMAAAYLAETLSKKQASIDTPSASVDGGDTEGVEARLLRHLARLDSRAEGVTLRESVEAAIDAGRKMLDAKTEYDADVWWATFRAHCHVIREDWDSEGNLVPSPISIGDPTDEQPMLESPASVPALPDWTKRAKADYPEIDTVRLAECARTTREILREPWEQAGTVEWLALQQERQVCRLSAAQSQIASLEGQVKAERLVYEINREQLTRSQDYAERLASKLAAAEADTKDVYADIRVERERQDAQWGGPDHDDEHTVYEWARYRAKFEKRASDMLDSDFEAVYEFADGRIALIKIAALTIAQIEALDRQHPTTASLPTEKTNG